MADKSWTGRLALEAGRWPFAVRFGLGLTLGACFTLYSVRSSLENYYRGTLYRTETVQLNMLHRTLPAALSAAIREGQPATAQSILNSNYGLFDIIVTSADGQRILMSSSGSYATESFEGLDLNALPEPFDLVLDPPDPDAASAVYSSLSDLEPTPGPAPRLKGRRILARIYYRRRSPPHFHDVLWGWLGNPFTSRPPASLIRDTLLQSWLAVLALVALYEVMLRRRQTDLMARQIQLARAMDDRNLLERQLAAERRRRDELEAELQREHRTYRGLCEQIDDLEVALEAESTNRDQSLEAAEQLESLRELAEERMERIHELTRLQESSSQQLTHLDAERALREEQVTSLRSQLRREKRALDATLEEAAERERALADSLRHLEDEVSGLRGRLVEAESVVASLSSALLAGLPRHEGRAAIHLAGDHHSSIALRPQAERLAKACTPFVRRIETFRWAPSQRRTISVRSPGDRLRVVFDHDAGYALLLYTTARNAVEGNALADWLRQLPEAGLADYEVHYLVDRSSTGTEG